MSIRAGFTLFCFGILLLICRLFGFFAFEPALVSDIGVVSICLGAAVIIAKVFQKYWYTV